MPPTPRAPVLRAAVVAFAAAGAVASAPGRASAACGDYVAVGGNPQTGHRADDAAGGPGRMPCDGPFCSERPTAPTPTPAAPAGGPSGGPEWAATNAPPGPPATNGPGRPIPAPADGLPVHSPRPVFHPPRAR